MSRVSRSGLLLLAARRAARGGLTVDRQLAVAQMRDAPLPFKEVVGLAKYAAACRLKDATLDLAGLEGEARTRQADRVVTLAAEFAAMPNVPDTDHPYAEDPHEGRYTFEGS